MTDVISVDTIRNGFLVEDHTTFSGPVYAKTTGTMMLEVLKGLFNRYYYTMDDEGNPSEEWQGIMDGIREFVKYMEPNLIVKWKEEAGRIAKEFEEKDVIPAPTNVITEEGVQDI